MNAKPSILMLLFNIIFGIAMILPFAVAGYAVTKPFQAQSKWTVEKLERAISVELPENSNREQVEAWFVKHAIVPIHSHYVNYYLPQPQDLTKSMDLNDEDCSRGLLRGFIDDKNELADESLVRISIYFVFDEDGLCTAHFVLPDQGFGG